MPTFPDSTQSPRTKRRASAWLAAVLVAACAAAAAPAAETAGTASATEDAARAPEAEAARLLPVVLVTDPAFRARPLWRGKARRLIEEGAADLVAAAGLRLRVDVEEEWTPPAETATFEQLIDALRERHPESERLVVLLVGARPAGGEEYVGYAALADPYLAVAADDDDVMRIAFRHELGHVFGLPHLPGRNVMADRTGERTRDFDQLSLDVLRATRGMDFGSSTPFAECDLEVLRDAYLAWLDRGHGDASLWSNLGVAFRRERRPRDARLAFEAALRLDRDSAAAWYHLGAVRAELGDSEGAGAAYRRSLELNPESPFAEAARRALQESPTPD